MLTRDGLAELEQRRRFTVYRLDGEGRRRVLDCLRRVLEGRREIAFAVVYGSFVRGDVFRDIDVGVYLAGVEDELVYCGLLEEELEGVAGFPVDLRVLNDALGEFLLSVLGCCVVLVDRGRYFEGLYCRALDELKRFKRCYSVLAGGSR